MIVGSFAVIRRHAGMVKVQCIKSWALAASYACMHDRMNT